MRHCNGIANCIYPLFAPIRNRSSTNNSAFSDFYEDLRAELGTAVGVIQDIYTPAPPSSGTTPLGLQDPRRLLTGYMQNLLCIAEDDPRRENRVSLASEQDVFGMELVQVEHAYSQRRLSPPPRSPGWLKQRPYCAKPGGLLRYRHLIDSFSHAIGTLRCATTPEEGVLDLDCRYWGSDNLYVSDGSFMPSFGRSKSKFDNRGQRTRVAERILAKR